jgi:hypothetical protein
MSTTIETPADAPFPPRPDEVITRSLVRDVQLPGGAGVMALITLDNGRDHTRPTTLGIGGLASLNAALDTVTARAAAGEIVAVGVTGKPFYLCAGFDLNVAVAAKSRQESLELIRWGHDVFRKLGGPAWPRPSTERLGAAEIACTAPTGPFCRRCRHRSPGDAA